MLIGFILEFPAYVVSAELPLFNVSETSLNVLNTMDMILFLRQHKCKENTLAFNLSIHAAKDSIILLIVYKTFVKPQRLISTIHAWRLVLKWTLFTRKDYRKL